MAATPPLQILDSPPTPLTPLHGAAYERKPTRQSSRIKQQLTAPSAPANALRAATPEADTPRPRKRRQSHNLNTVTPRKAKASLGANTAAAQSPPQSTPRRASRRLHVIPPSPNAEELSPPPTKPSHRAPHRLQPFLSSTTTVISEGMLPTPVKTPSKKLKAAAVHTAAAAAVAGRALFQDQLGDAAERQRPITVAAPSPRRTRKSKRYNGFSLESFAAAADADDEGDRAGIQIFTDNRDKVPEPDTDKSNPFIDHPEAETAATTGVRARKAAASGSSRTRTRKERRLDPQVEDAIRNDDGMVCVFRGKKVYRRFNDSFEEEEEIDDLDLGLLEHTEDGAPRTRRLKTLTRKSIKPTRLFQQEVQRRARERAKEEEAPTDIDEAGDDEADEAEDEAEDAEASPTNRRRSVASLDTKSKVSPFDAWPRVKPGTRSASAAKKRSANEAELSDEPVLASSFSSGTTAKVRKTRATAAV
ncbi:hypothetical protein DV735_g271, partial [Chaetothyriales sp. CBS 134920]